MTCKGTLRQVFICLMPRTPYPPPPPQYFICVYRARIFLTFKGPSNRFQGINSASLCSLAARYDNPITTRFLAPMDCLKIEQERRLEGQQFTKLGIKYEYDWLYLQSINSDKHLPQSPFTGSFFRWRHFTLVYTYIFNKSTLHTLKIISWVLSAMFHTSPPKQILL